MLYLDGSGDLTKSSKFVMVDVCVLCKPTVNDVVCLFCAMYETVYKYRLVINSEIEPCGVILLKYKRQCSVSVVEM